MLELKNISKKYNNKEVLNNVNVVFLENTLNIVVGEKGSGKTTLLNIVSKKEISYSGEINLHKKDKIISNLVDNNSNVLFDYSSLLSLTKDEAKINRCLEKLSMTNIKNKSLTELTKSEQYVLGILVVLLSKSNIVLIDEPTIDLDSKTRKRVFDLLKSESAIKTIILATSDLESAKTYADTIYKLKNTKLELIYESLDCTKKTSILEPKSLKIKRILLTDPASRAFQKNALLFINLVLIILVIVELFIGLSFKNINLSKTSDDFIDSMPNSIYKVNDDPNFKGDYYSIDTYSKLQSDYINDRQIYPEVAFSSWESFYGERMSGVFYSDVKDILSIDTDLDNYILPNKYVDTEEVKYYPVIISKEFRDMCAEHYHHFFEIGDLLPFSYMPPMDIFTEKFVIVDLYDGDYNNTIINDARDTFPIILPKQSYYDLIDNYGIPDYSFISELDKKYEELKKDFPKGDYRVLSIISSSASLQTIDNLSGIKSYDEMGDNEEGLCYIGSIPANDNEIMIGNYQEYYLMNGIYDKSSKTLDMTDTKEKSSDFLEKYKDGFDIDLCKFSSYSYGISNVKIVGAYAYKKDGKLANFNYNGNVIINSNLMDKITYDIYNNSLTLSNNRSYYYSKEVLKDSYLSILNNELTLNAPIFDDYRDTMDTNSFSNARLYTFLVLFILSILTTFVYLRLLNDNISKHFLELKRNKNKVRIREIIYFTIPFLVPFILAIPLCTVYLNKSINFNLIGYFSNTGYSFNFFYPILSIVFLFVFYSVISSVYSHIIRK